MTRLLSSRLFAIGFLAAATVVFSVRGPARAVANSYDLAPPYGAARAWLVGRDPYADSSLNAVLIDAGRELERPGRASFLWSLYPPPSFVVLAPFAALRWPQAKIAFAVFALALVLAHLRPLIRLADAPAGSIGAVWVAAGTLALAPYHTGLAFGQVAIPCIALLVIAADLLHRGHTKSGAVSLALAVLFKPQLAGPFLLYFGLRRQRRATIYAIVICAVATIVSIGWLELNDVDWLASWSTTTRSILVPGGHHDPSGPLSAQLVELRPLLSAVAGIQSPGLLGFGIAVVLGIHLYVRGRSLGRDHDTLLLAGVAVLTLFATYHRFYDAAVISLAVAWVVGAHLHNPELRSHARAGALCVAVFFAPGAWMLQRLVNDGSVPAEVARSFVWNAVLLRHQNWALVILYACVVMAVERARRSAPSMLA